MKEPWSNGYVWRYLIRSKDRLSGTPNNFTVQLPNPIPDNVADCWCKITTLALDTFPNPADTTSTGNLTSGMFNQPNFSSTSAYNNYGFDTGCGVDICLAQVGTVNTVDTESITATNQYTTSAVINAGSAQTSITVPISNKTGICVSGPGYSSGTGDQASLPGITPTMVATGFTSTGVTFQFLPTPGTTTATWSSIAQGAVLSVTPAQAIKSRADKTILFVPYGRGDYERTLRLWKEPAWNKVNVGNLSTLQVKLFNDKGFPLKLKKFFYNTSGDSNDINIDEWMFEMLVTTQGPLGPGGAPHKI